MFRKIKTISNKKIIVIGNIASGKTTISKMLSKKMKVDHIELDEFRRKHNKKMTQEGEDRAREMFFRAINKKGMQIIELTGSGKVYQELKNELHQKEKFIIKLECDEKILLKRVKDRLKTRYVFPPLPSSWDMKSDLDGLTRGIKWIGDNIFETPDVTVSTAKLKPEEIVVSLIKSI